MDIKAEIECALEQMEWAEVMSTLQAAVYSLLTNTSSPLPPVSVGLEFNTYSQPAASQGAGYGADVSSLHQGDFLHSGHLHSNSAYGRVQYINVPAVRLPDATNYNLHPIREMKREMSHEMPVDFVFAVPQTSKTVKTSKPKRRKGESQQTGDRPYVKKPPNAFMLYAKEQRPNVAPEISKRGSATVNKHLGEKWKSLTDEKRAKYFYQANQEKWFHKQLHPGWSTGENYGKKKKRDRRKTVNKAAASEPADNTQQAKWLCSMPLQSVMVPSTPQPIMMEASYTPIGWRLHLNTQITATVPEMCHLPKLYMAGPTPPVMEHFELLYSAQPELPSSVHVLI